MALTTM